MSSERAMELLENFRGGGIVHYLFFVVMGLRKDVGQGA